MELVGICTCGHDNNTHDTLDNAGCDILTCPCKGFTPANKQVGLREKIADIVFELEEDREYHLKQADQILALIAPYVYQIAQEERDLTMSQYEGGRE